MNLSTVLLINPKTSSILGLSPSCDVWAITSPPILWKKEDDLVPRHKKHHCLIVVQDYQYDELVYVHSRRFANASNLEEMETYVRKFDDDTYKSQEHRYKDPWISYGKYGSMPSEVSVMTKQNLTIIMLLAYAPLYLLVTWSLTLLLYLEYWGIGMMYQVNYMKPKKKGYAKQTATFVKIDDAVFWEKVMTEQGCTDFQILVK